MALSGYVNASIGAVIENIGAGALQRSDTCFVENASLIHQLNSCCSQSCFDCVPELDGVSQVSTLWSRWFLITTDDLFRIFSSPLFFLQMCCSLWHLRQFFCDQYSYLLLCNEKIWCSIRLIPSVDTNVVGLIGRSTWVQQWATVQSSCNEAQGNKCYYCKGQKHCMCIWW